eukprot:3341711-Rhodomonas_salina.2
MTVPVTRLSESPGRVRVGPGAADHLSLPLAGPGALRQQLSLRPGGQCQVWLETSTVTAPRMKPDTPRLGP